MEDKILRENIFDNYIETINKVPVKTNHHIPHKRNLEGFEDMFLKFIPADKNTSILDIGCGCGQLLYMLRENGYKRIKGIDIGGSQIEIAKELKIPAEKITDLQEYLNSNKGWDAVIMSQVIEHFPKDKLHLYLNAVKKSIKIGGRIIIATPNMALVSAAFQRYIDFTHEIGFTERSLREVLRVSGFKNIEIYGDEISIKWRPKFLIWYILRNIWFAMLSFIYLLERGTERPKIISRHLIAIASNG